MLKRLSPAFIVMLSLSACSGGGGGSSTPPSLPNDPLFGDQWHLENTGQGGGTVGEDANVVPVWNGGYRGDGITVVVVDDGLEIAHEDLTDNIIPGLSYNYVDGMTDPTGDSSDTVNYLEPSFHGTNVAGVIGARDLNNIGGRGAAPRAGLLGYNLLQDPTTLNDADAMTRNVPSIDISNNSWGSPDGTGQLSASNFTWRSAIETGLSTGAGGLGTVYVWAAGNGATLGADNSNYDGLANYRGVMAVAALADDGKKASYSERGANLWVSAHAGEDCGTHAITTTDRMGSEGYNVDGTGEYANTNYTKCFNGTSSATPLVSGVVALILQAKPTLTWRDARLILAQTARKNDPADAEWMTNGAGYQINQNYGFGAVDADAAVSAALSWTNVGAEAAPHTTALSFPGLAIPDNNITGVSDTIVVGGSGINSIEFVEITFSAADHTYFGDLWVTLENETTGTTSILAETHLCYLNDGITPAPCSPSYNNWVFGSTRHLGEAADGNWTLRVWDFATLDTGTFQSWQLKFYGR